MKRLRGHEIKVLLISAIKGWGNFWLIIGFYNLSSTFVVTMIVCAQELTRLKELYFVIRKVGIVFFLSTFTQ